MSLAGIPQTALHMSKVQFYSCLKLIAAHQQSMPLRQELIASTVALHLPTFNWKKSPTLNGTLNDMTRWRSSIGESPNLIELARLETHSDVANSDVTSTDSEVEHNETDKKSHAVCIGMRFCLLQLQLRRSSGSRISHQSNVLKKKNALYFAASSWLAGSMEYGQR